MRFELEQWTVLTATATTNIMDNKNNHKELKKTQTACASTAWDHIFGWNYPRDE